MVSIIATIFTVAALFNAVSSHMLLKTPPSLGYKGNSFVTNIDYDLVSPLTNTQFPCKQYHKDASRGAGKVVATWAAGSTQSYSLEGYATHEGGSCQVSLSYDNGATFKVMRSWIGACPTDAGGPFIFTIPRAAPNGQAIFAWTWFNKIGNREMYMGCAIVNITGGGSGLGNYPNVFTANIGGTCTVTEGFPVEFPNPGSDVVRSGEVSRAPVCT
ncbi:hypothetical protein EDC01DRAFT_756652 [Geopyxis carbonaria]|nr:hypothetical protein EDC01DRAFT_756652 [Geopyxis carbonaria]